MFGQLKDNIRDLSALIKILSYWVRDRIDEATKNDSGSLD